MTPAPRPTEAGLTMWFVRCDQEGASRCLQSYTVCPHTPDAFATDSVITEATEATQVPPSGELILVDE